FRRLNHTRFICGFFCFFSKLAVAFHFTTSRIMFLILNGKKEDSFKNNVSLYSIESILRYRKVAWRIWWLFIGIVLISITAVQFGSNLWFWRPVTMEGPYQHAVLFVTYLIPFTSLIIPMLFSKSVMLIQKNRAGEPNEY
ncbi:hypothetical protein A1A1_16480, partial [Planococcus antarcticus DSM 14505]